MVVVAIILPGNGSRRGCSSSSSSSRISVVEWLFCGGRTGVEWSDCRSTSLGDSSSNSSGGGRSSGGMKRIVVTNGILHNALFKECNQNVTCNNQYVTCNQTLQKISRSFEINSNV